MAWFLQVDLVEATGWRSFNRTDHTRSPE